MAVVQVLETDNFQNWFDKTNEIATNQGDIATLDPSLGASDLVEAVNAVSTASGNNSIVYAIALG